MFEGEDHQALQTLTENETILPDAHWTPTLALKAIQSVIKEDVHFWHQRDQLLSDLCQLPEEGIYGLSKRINTLVSKYKFPNEEVKEIIKIMVLQHAVKDHEARDWICMQDQTTLTYQSLLAHCKQLEARCVSNSNKPKPRAELTLPPSQLPHLVTPQYMLTSNPVPNNPAQVMVTIIPTEAVLPSNVNVINVIIATILGISMPCAEDPTLVDDQPLLTSTENLEEGPADLAITEDQAGHLVGEDRHREATPIAPSISAPVTAPYRTVAEEDPPDMEDAVPHLTGTRSATLCLLIPIHKMKVNLIKIGHLMAKGASTWHCN